VVAKKDPGGLDDVLKTFVSSQTSQSDFDRLLNKLIQSVKRIAHADPEPPEEVKVAVDCLLNVAQSLKAYRKAKDIDAITKTAMNLGWLAGHLELLRLHVSMILSAKTILHQRDSLRLGPFSSYGSKEKREKITAEWKREYDRLPPNWSDRRRCMEIAKTTPYRNLSRRDKAGNSKPFTWQAISKAIQDPARH
jgi:hypothetical protein